MKTNETVTIDVSEYLYLRQNSALLEALQGGGVDNWDGYDFSLEHYDEEEVKKEVLEEIKDKINK